MVRTRRRAAWGTLACIAAACVASSSQPALAGGCPADVNGTGTVDAFDLSLVLGLWGNRGGPGDIDGSGSVDGGDLAMLLDAWGVCGCDGSFGDMHFIDQVVDLSALGSDVAVELNGALAVSRSGEANGSVSAAFGGLSAAIAVTPLTVKVDIDEHHVDFLMSGAAGLMVVDGQATSIVSAIELFAAEIGSDAAPSQWSPSTQAFFAFEALANTQQSLCFIAALDQAQDQQDALNGWGCKWAATAAGGAITAVAAGGCALLLAGCASATTITLGGVAVPCYILIGLCAGGTYVGAQATYDAILAWWKT